MHTCGAIVLVLLISIILQFAGVLIAGFLGGGIAATTGHGWPGEVMLFFLSGCAGYGGVYAGRKIANRGSAKVAAIFYAIICVVSAGNGVIEETSASNFGLSVSLIANTAANLAGIWIACHQIHVERSFELSDAQ